MVINLKDSIRRMTVLNVQTRPGDNYRPKNRIMYIIKIFSNKTTEQKNFIDKIGDTLSPRLTENGQ